MNRRGFLKALAGAAIAVSAGGIALLEEELWEPSKTIVLPPSGGWVTRGGNTLLTMSAITNEVLKVLHQELVFTDGLNGHAKLAGAIANMNVNVRKPPRYIVAVENADWYGNRVRA